MAFLKVMSGSAKGHRFDIDRDEVVIGRAQDNAVVIEGPSVSSKHCAIIRDGRRFTLRDLESTNGTRLNDVRISEYQLSPGDTIDVGSIEVLFDGDDIDAYKPLPDQDNAQVTLKLPATDTQRMTPAFNARKKKPWIAIIAIALGAIALLAAMALFLSRLFGD